jgi:hypothetical protein
MAVSSVLHPMVGIVLLIVGGRFAIEYFGDGVGVPRFQDRRRRTVRWVIACRSCKILRFLESKKLKLHFLSFN